MPDVAALPGAATLAAVAAAAAADLRGFRVANSLTLPLLVTGLVYHGVMSRTVLPPSSLLGALFGGGVLFVFYLLGGMGAGDVKLLAGVGAWLGLPLTVYVFLGAALSGGCYAAVLLTLPRRPKAAGRPEVDPGVRRADRRRLVPFAAMILIGVVVTLIGSFPWGASP